MAAPFPILCISDDASRECPGNVVDNSLFGDGVAHELDVVVERLGYPCMIVSDNGTEPPVTA